VAVDERTQSVALGVVAQSVHPVVAEAGAKHAATERALQQHLAQKRTYERRLEVLKAQLAKALEDAGYAEVVVRVIVKVAEARAPVGLFRTPLDQPGLPLGAAPHGK
jgi:hypothetical protein